MVSRKIQGRPIDLLDSKHLMSTLLYINDNGPCRKIQLYDNVSRNVNMPKKFQSLIDMDLIAMDSTPEGQFFSLTETGRIVAHNLSMIEMHMESAAEQMLPKIQSNSDEPVQADGGETQD